MSCVAKQVANPPTPLPTASLGRDAWVRVQLWTVGQSGNLSTWVSGADVVALSSRSTAIVSVFSVAAAGPYLSSNAWQCFTAGSGSAYTVDQRLTNPPTSSNGTPAVQNGAYVAVRVDQYGSIVGVVGIGSNTGSSTVANTCWASFNGVPIL